MPRSQRFRRCLRAQLLGAGPDAPESRRDQTPPYCADTASGAQTNPKPIAYDSLIVLAATQANRGLFQTTSARYCSEVASISVRRRSRSRVASTSETRQPGGGRVGSSMTQNGTSTRRAPDRPRSSLLLEAGEVVDLEAVGLAVRLVALERGLRVLAGDDRAGVVEEQQLAGGDRDRLHLLVADDDGLVRGGGGLVDDVAGPRDPVMLEVAPGAADRVDDHGAGVVVGRHVSAGRHAEAGDDLAADRVDLVVLEQDLVAVGRERHPRQRLGVDVAGHDVLVQRRHGSLSSGCGCRGHSPASMSASLRAWDWWMRGEMRCSSHPGVTCLAGTDWISLRLATASMTAAATSSGGTPCVR